MDQGSDHEEVEKKNAKDDGSKGTLEGDNDKKEALKKDGRSLEIEDDEASSEKEIQPKVDLTEKMLSFYPGNKVRKKAIVVDLGDYE